MSHRKCRWWQHDWMEDQWVGGIATPMFVKVCRKCGKSKQWTAGP